jgi:predicted nucleotidyltransferase
VADYSEAINWIKNIIIREYQPDAIILFGSHARKNAKSQSDIDILVISDREKQLPRYKRGLNVRIKLSEIKTPKDILSQRSVINCQRNKRFYIESNNRHC